MNLSGLMMVVFCFGVMWIMHQLVKRAEGCFSKKCRPVFFMAGITFMLISICVRSAMLSVMFGIASFACLWNIFILYEHGKIWIKDVEQAEVRPQEAGADEE